MTRRPGRPRSTGADRGFQLGPLPDDPAELVRALPDEPRWLYARSTLLSGAASVRVAAARDAALVLDPSVAVLVGRPDADLLANPAAPALLVEQDVVGAVRSAVPGWTARPFVVHALPEPFPASTVVPQGVVVSDPLDPAVLAGLPDDVVADAADAPAAAVRTVDGRPVAVCAVSDRTETLWDVGIDTVDGARRKGHATAVFRALAAAMAARGRQPVWAAYADYPPSLALAERLGFRPVARMVELTPGPVQGCR